MLTAYLECFPQRDAELINKRSENRSIWSKQSVDANKTCDDVKDKKVTANKNKKKGDANKDDQSSHKKSHCDNSGGGWGHGGSGPLQSTVCGGYQGRGGNNNDGY